MAGITPQARHVAAAGTLLLLLYAWFTHASGSTAAVHQSPPALGTEAEAKMKGSPRGVLQKNAKPMQGHEGSLPAYGGNNQMVPDRFFEQLHSECKETCCVPAAQALYSAAKEARRHDRPPKGKPQKRVSYIKTHKTGSTTLGSIMFRFGARNRLVLYKSPSHDLRTTYFNKKTIPADIVLYHYAGIATRLQRIAQWEEAYRWYNTVVPNGAFITILREPLSHYISYFYFYDEPDRNAPSSLEEAVDKRRNKDILMRDFAVLTRQELDKFMKIYAPQFKTILISNRITESLVVLAYDLGWSLLDMSYVKLLDSHSEAGSVRWDGRPVKPSPSIFSLPEALVDRIKELTQLDQVFYEYAERKLNKSISDYGPGVADAVKALDTLNAALNRFCGCADLGPPGHKFCEWYALGNQPYERLIREDGSAPAQHLPWLDI